MKEELKVNSINQIIKENCIYEAGDEVTTIALVVKGRVRIKAVGVNVVVGSGNFLGICDLNNKIHGVTYIAETNLAIYVFQASTLQGTVRNLFKANKDYAPLMISTLSKYIRELSKIYNEFENAANEFWEFIKESYQNYQQIGKTTGTPITELRSVENLDIFEPTDNVNLDKIEYYRACSEINSDVQKAYFGSSAVISMAHITEQIQLVTQLKKELSKDAEYLKKLAGPLITDTKSVYCNVIQQANMLQHMNIDTSEVMNLFDRIIESVNKLENMLLEHGSVDLQIDHEFMEEAYFELMNDGVGQQEESMATLDGDIALVEDSFISTDELVDGLEQILEYAEIESEEENAFREYINDFIALPDKFSTDDTVRTLRRNIQKVYYKIYKNVFLKDYQSDEKTPLVIDLFLRYGFISEKLISEQIQEELLGMDSYHSGMGLCSVYDMKEWLTLILKGEKEPSKSEFDLDYEENLRDMKKTGQITAEQQKQMATNLHAKFDYEIHNMFRTNHRLLSAQITAFVPFLFTEGCSGSLGKCYLSKDRINATIQKLLQIDYSVFYRESLYAQPGPFAKEYIQQDVYPDIIVFPGFGNKGVMWQELSGRRRTSKGRFLLPTFMEGDLSNEMIKLFGRFRWELCRTIQGASWNNIQIKSLTSEYSDFVQFYRKNHDLSEDKKEKLKLQIQKCRNNTREVFVIDYENWMKHEAQGGLCLSKPVREIMAMYCPFGKELREKVSDQPIFNDAMARYNRECGKKKKDYEMKFKVWEKDGIDIPEEVIKTRKFYTEL